MDRGQLLAMLTAAGVEIDARRDRTLSLSSNLLRVQDARQILPRATPGTAALFVPGALDLKAQVYAYVDVIHWIRSLDLGDRVNLVLGRGEATPRVLDAIATLDAVNVSGVSVDVLLAEQQGLVPARLKRPTFNGTRPTWPRQLQQRGGAAPEVALALQQEVGDGAFVWYRNVSASHWSGRVDGLEVTRLRRTRGGAFCASLSVGQTVKEPSDARRGFCAALADLGIDEQPHDDPRELTIGSAWFEELTGAIQRLARERALPRGRLYHVEPEHRLEARILRGDLRLELPDGRALVAPLVGPCTARGLAGDLPFQFPALWSPEGRTRYIDLLMREHTDADRDIPWVVELKVPSGGTGQYYRHAAAQAALYREFIRSNEDLAAWFHGRRADPQLCQAAVAFPALDDDARHVRGGLAVAAQALDVSIIEVSRLDPDDRFRDDSVATTVTSPEAES